VSALGALTPFAEDDQAELKAIGELIRKERDPEDAWALGRMAEAFIARAMFDDAIAYSREALKVMDHGVGRLTLAAALYGKAAELTRDKKDKQAGTLIVEANALVYDKASVLSRFEHRGEAVDPLMPILYRIIP
jgi:hypothetical protein